MPFTHQGRHNFAPANVTRIALGVFWHRAHRTDLNVEQLQNDRDSHRFVLQQPNLRNHVLRFADEVIVRSFDMTRQIFTRLIGIAAETGVNCQRQRSDSAIVERFTGEAVSAHVLLNRRRGGRRKRDVLWRVASGQQLHQRRPQHSSFPFTVGGAVVRA
jgi:hypothetical protein